MAGFKVGFIMFRIIHCSSAFPGLYEEKRLGCETQKGQYGKRGGREGDNRMGRKEGRSGGTGKSIAGWRNGGGEGK